MQMLLGDVVVFCAAVIRHWGTLMTGGIIIAIIAVWEHLACGPTCRPVPPDVYRWIMGGFLLVAIFQAWRAQYRRANAPVDGSLAIHSEDLREKILVPMLDYLDGFIIPVLDRKCGNVVLWRRRLPRPSAAFMEDPTESTETLGLGMAAEPPPIDPVIDHGRDTLPKPVRDGALYEDARDIHFKKLISLWEPLLDGFDRYNETCLEYVKHLSTEILKDTAVPEHDPRSDQPRWVYARALALIVFYGHLGLPRIPLEAETDTRPSCYLRDAGSHYFAQGSPDDITRCVEVLETLHQKKDWIDDLNKNAAGSRSEVLAVKAEIDRLLVTRTPPEKCPYSAGGVKPA